MPRRSLRALQECALNKGLMNRTAWSAEPALSHPGDNLEVTEDTRVSPIRNPQLTAHDTPRR